jgi:hypothetical protein
MLMRGFQSLFKIPVTANYFKGQAKVLKWQSRGELDDVLVL